VCACVNTGRWEVDDVTTAGDAIWSGVHGHTTLEHTGFFGAVERDPIRRNFRRLMSDPATAVRG
jgi:hypothetical protein